MWPTCKILPMRYVVQSILICLLCYMQSMNGSTWCVGSTVVNSAVRLSAPRDVVSVSTGSGKVTLWWQSVTQEAGFRVYRSSSPRGPWSKLNSLPMAPKDPGPVPNGYMYSDTGLKDGAEYFYYVVTVDAAGRESDHSSVTSATPDPASIPWDTGDPKRIIAAWKEILGDDSVTACGPNGVIYESTPGHPIKVLPPVRSLTVENSGTVSSPRSLAKAPKIAKVYFTEIDKQSRRYIKAAKLTQNRMTEVRTLYSDVWQEVPEFSVSPSGKQLLVTRHKPTRADIDQDLNNLLLVALPTGQVKILRNDDAGYHILGWSSDSQFISYVSYEGKIPYIGAPTPRVLYVSAADGKWRKRVQAGVTDAKWLPGKQVVAYTSNEIPGLAAYCPQLGKKIILSRDAGGGSLLVSHDGKRLLWFTFPTVQLIQVPMSSRVADEKAWKTVVKLDLSAEPSVVAGGLSSDGSMVTLIGPDKASSYAVAILNLLTGKSVVYSSASGLPYEWADDDCCLIGAVRSGGLYPVSWRLC